MRRTIFAAVCLTLMSGGSAWPKWFNGGEESAFAVSGTFTVSTLNDRGYVLGFRCEERGLYVVYVTNEALEPGDVPQLEQKTVALLVRVDDETPRTYFGHIESSNRYLRVTAASEVFLPKQVSEARRRITVAIRKGDRIIHESSFSAVGSTKALLRFGKSCGFVK